MLLETTLHFETHIPELESKNIKKIATWNVNGIRSVIGKGFSDWVKAHDFDVICLQETKARTDLMKLLQAEVTDQIQYSGYWFSAKRPGYSGVAILSKVKPEKVVSGLGDAQFDSEGRWLEVHFKNCVVISAYFPNSQREGVRLSYKLAFCESALKRMQALVKEKKVPILAGDYNIAHTALDLANPKTNEKNAGYLPEERAFMTQFLEAGFCDPFREKHPEEKGHYTWWSYRPGVREKNIGWRLDLFALPKANVESVKDVFIQHQIKGSDHCPVVIELK